MKRQMMKICVMVSMMLIAFSGYGSKVMSGWEVLERQGDVYRSQMGLNKASGKIISRHVEPLPDDVKKWFCQVISYSIATNETDLYVFWLNRKTTLLRDFFYIVNLADPENTSRMLIEYLSHLKKLRVAGDSRSYLEEHKKKWSQKQDDFTSVNQKEWKANYRRDKKLRTAVGRAVTDIESMIERLYVHSSPERKKALLKMVIDITGETPKWYKKEMDEAAAGRKAGK